MSGRMGYTLAGGIAASSEYASVPMRRVVPHQALVESMPVQEEEL